MHHRFKLFSPIILTLMALAGALCAVIFFFAEPWVFYICAAACFVVFAVALVMLRLLNTRTRTLLDEIAQAVKQSMGGAYCELPTPVLTVIGGNEIVWYNELCAEHVFGGRDMRGQDIADVFPTVDPGITSPPEGYSVEYGDKKYTMFVATLETSQGNGSILYMVDDTQLKYYAHEYRETRPSVALIVVDNYEELVPDYKDSERAQLMTEVEQAVESYISRHHGFVTKLARDRFVAVIQSRGVRKMLADKVELLDIVRKLAHGHRMPPSLSIGISGESSDLYQAELSARQAVDMCLGRGGDQAAVKTSGGYEFYGGMSKAIEKRTRVKTRIIATALSELIETSSSVMLMGHRFADLDSLGASVGMFKAVRSMGKPAAICIDREKNLAQPLLERLMEGGYQPEDFVSPDAALSLIDSRTLLIVMDTHLPGVLESEAVYRAARNVVVIDHHRKMVGHIEGAVIFYHEPYASSTCEMVAELVQYFPGGPALSRTDAEALMAGIMLDTRNFMMRTGVRTFEAAAWLRRLGADTVEVRKLFASSMESYRQKAGFIAGAEIYRGCAIATCEHPFDNIKIIAPQTADELITISGVDASFVIFPHDNLISVSGRSMEAINVQLIMERLGGGGHQTMAAAQFPEGEMDTEAVRGKLVQAIDDYYASINSKTLTQEAPGTQGQ